MTKRTLHLVAYDIREPRRLARVLHIVRAYATGGQKSVHECFLSALDRTEVVAALKQVVRQHEDSVVVIRLDPRAVVRTLGIAEPPRDGAFFYFG